MKDFASFHAHTVGYLGYTDSLANNSISGFACTCYRILVGVYAYLGQTKELHLGACITSLYGCHEKVQGRSLRQLLLEPLALPE